MSTPEKDDIQRARKENGDQPNKTEAKKDQERPSKVPVIDPQLDKDDLRPDTGPDEAGPEKADIERAQREKSE